MKNQIQIKNTILSINNSLPRPFWPDGFALTGLALAILALSPAARATDRGNGNTSDGASALLHLTTGSFNTGLGSTALEALTTASNNTATGAGALIANTSGHENTADGTDALQALAELDRASKLPGVHAVGLPTSFGGKALRSCRHGEAM